MFYYQARSQVLSIRPPYPLLFFMSYNAIAVLTLLLCYGSVIFVLAGKVKPLKPPYGWCQTNHSPRKPAQSGYKGYCKQCYKQIFPDDHKIKHAKRKAECKFCRSVAELTQAGYCRPCARARSCEGCGEVNIDSNARICVGCSSNREAMGAKQDRLAMWCLTCTSTQERMSALCVADNAYFVCASGDS